MLAQNKQAKLTEKGVFPEAYQALLLPPTKHHQKKQVPHMLFVPAPFSLKDNASPLSDLIYFQILPVVLR